MEYANYIRTLAKENNVSYIKKDLVDVVLDLYNLGVVNEKYEEEGSVIYSFSRDGFICTFEPAIKTREGWIIPPTVAILDKIPS